MLSFYCKAKSFIHTAVVRARAEEGQPALEYIAIAVVVVAGIIGALAVFGDDVEQEVSGLFSDIFDS